GAPLDRARGRILMAGVLAGLRDEAHALSGEIDSVAALRSRIAAKKGERAAAQSILAHERDELARMAARRGKLTHQLLRTGKAENPAANSAPEAGDLAELIKRAEADMDRRDKALLARARAALP